MKYILTHDFGTSGDKASLFSTEGQHIGTKTMRYPSYYSNGNWAEQDPENWWKAFCQSTKELLKNVDAKDVLCVVCDGTHPNCIVVDEEFKPLTNALMWQDTRAYLEANELSDLLPDKYTAGHPNGKLSPCTLPKLYWLKKNKPDIFNRIYKMFPCAMDYIILKLTGNAVSSLETCRTTAMANLESNAWSEEVLEIAGIPMSIMPELHAKTDIVGEVPDGFLDVCGLAQGTKIVMGAGDADCTRLGAGLLNEGDAFMNGGTSAGVFGKIAGGRTVGGGTTSSGASLDWLKNTICHEEQRIAAETGRSVYDIISEEIDQAPLGSHGVLFHPYLSGERAPRNNPRAKGSYTGLSSNATRYDLMRSVIEGIGMNINVILQRVVKAGCEVHQMPIVGGLGKSPVFRQIFADIMNVELFTLATMDEAANVGAAVYGGIALGLYEDEPAVKKFIKVTSHTYPDPARHEQYEKIIPLFEKVYESQLPIYELM